MIYANFESILAPEEFYIKTNIKNIACSYGYKLDHKFSKPFKSYLGKHAAYSFINYFIEDRKYCSEVMKKHFIP